MFDLVINVGGWILEDVSWMLVFILLGCQTVQSGD